jgi:hypothetical protein
MGEVNVMGGSLNVLSKLHGQLFEITVKMLNTGKDDGRTTDC